MPQERIRIAVVDDHSSFRTALQRLLSASGLDVETFASGQEFLDSLEDRRPDCLLLDLQMPGLTGLEVQRRLALGKISFPTIIITAHNEPEMQAECRAFGAVGYLSKPVERGELLTAIYSALRQTREPRNDTSL